MSSLPKASVLVRTWFGGDDTAWEALLRAVGTPSEEGFLAGVVPVNDSAFTGLDAGELARVQPGGAIASFLADQRTLTEADQPILAVWVLPLPAVDIRPVPQPFRVVPGQLWSVENNINLANMDWLDYTSNLGPDGVFRGFR